MARKTVRVEIPTGKPEELIKLAQKVVAKHQAGNGNSPLDAAKMTALATAVSAADTSNNDAKTHDAQAQSARQLRDGSLGIGAGQTASTPDTALNLVNYVRDQLLIKFEGNEEALATYGFDVVVGTAKSPSRKQVPQPA